MNVSFHIALRYLFSKKSHNVINVISAVGALGLAIGTAALVLILSVYNGFNEIVDDSLSDLDADYVLRREGGEPFDWTEIDDILTKMQADERIASISSVLGFQVFLNYGGEQAVARVKGVDEVFAEVSKIDRHIISGNFELWHGDLSMACVGAGLASQLHLSPYFTQQIEIFYPDREKAVSMVNPQSSLHKEAVFPGSVFSVSEELDRDVLIVPISVAQKLYDAPYVSEIGLYRKGKAEFIKDYVLPEGFIFADRYRQHEDIYKMMKTEKFAIFLILVFVVLIIALNISGSLSMLKMEKAHDMDSLRAMGAEEGMIRRIFIYEGWMVSWLGIAAGLLMGLAVALLQQHFGFVKIPGNYLVEAYPVVIKAGDILVAVAALCLVGLGVALIPDSKNE